MMFKNPLFKGHNADEAPEADKPPVGMLSLAMALLSLFLIVAAVVCYYVVFFQSNRMMVERVYSVPNQELIDLQNRNNERLYDYKEQEETGRFQIPIDRAMDIIVSKPSYSLGNSLTR